MYSQWVTARLPHLMALGTFGALTNFSQLQIVSPALAIKVALGFYFQRCNAQASKVAQYLSLCLLWSE